MTNDKAAAVTPGRCTRCATAHLTTARPATLVLGGAVGPRGTATRSSNVIEGYRAATTASHEDPLTDPKCTCPHIRRASTRGPSRQVGRSIQHCPTTIEAGGRAIALATNAHVESLAWAHVDQASGVAAEAATCAR